MQLLSFAKTKKELYSPFSDRENTVLYISKPICALIINMEI